MKIFYTLFAFAFIASFAQIEAQSQHGLIATHEMNDKVYVEIKDLHFSNEGIFWQKGNKWIPVSGVDHDSQGLYLTSSKILSNYRAICRTCGAVYINRVPSRCDVCLNTSFDIEYEDIWDRKE